MSIRLMVIALLLLSLPSVTYAEGLAIKGAVKGADGKPLAGAQVQVQRLDGKGAALTTTTNAKGEYSFRNLDLGAYKVTTIVNKVPKQIASIRTRTTAWVRVDFDLAANTKPKKKRMVWVAGETGTHIGSGHWEEVDDSNTGKGASSMERVDGRALNLPGNALNPVGGVSGPGQ